MAITRKGESALLFLGDLALFFAALWLTLAVRHLEFPSSSLFYSHIIPFSILFAVWVLVFFIAGLYDKHTVIFKSRLPDTILNAQLFNVSIAAIFFFFIPYFGIAPKTNLIIYLFMSSSLILLWRIYIFPSLGISKKQKAVLIGSGREITDLVDEINNNARYNFEFVFVADLRKISNPNELQKEVLERVGPQNVSIIVCDTKNDRLEPLLPLLYNLTFLNTKLHFIDIHKMYEDIFDRVPLSLIKYDWFIENISISPKPVYKFLKRLIDIVVSTVLGCISLLVYPFVILAIKFEDGKQIFVIQERVGKNNKPIRIIKFRTMSRDDKGKEVLNNSNKVTYVGSFLRKTRIDELPQLLNVLKGDVSLIGPRPELPELAHIYSEKIPYYNTRHIIKPGLSGWAQIHHENHPHHRENVAETKVKLSYDFHYIKNRSVLLDIHIALRTIKTLLSRSGA